MKTCTLLSGLALALSMAASHAAKGGSSSPFRNSSGTGKTVIQGSSEDLQEGSVTVPSFQGRKLQLLPGQCEICTPENKIRPTELVVSYIGGLGVISRYQDGEKATCRDQSFPESGSFSAYGVNYDAIPGTTLTLLATSNGGKFDAETDFFFPGFDCFIHTSCSQPLVAGDQIGPFLILQGNDCTFPYCGDGIVQTGEQCDEGPTMPTATCRADCTQPFCGDGILDANEECDFAVEGATDCTQDCTVEFCGDGIKQANEECDYNDPNAPAFCRGPGAGQDCNQIPCCTIPICGDGIVDTAMEEMCDNGSPGVDTLACLSTCKLPFCGDGFWDQTAGEECDPMDTADTLECRDDCTRPFCGDGILDAGETCDTDSVVGIDCRASCNYCGDGNIDTSQGEMCDPPTVQNGGNCLADCTIQPPPIVTPPFCGDGILDTGEACDDGNTINTDACRNDCTVPFCGDGILDPGEACDSFGQNTATCRADCTQPICGDGILDTLAGEECDNGALNGPGAECKADCTLCVCETSATYDSSNGAVTITFDMCDQEPALSDFVAIYRCDSSTFTADQQWWCEANNLNPPAGSSSCGPFDHGYTEGEVYNGDDYEWFAYTCGNPFDEGCQRDRTIGNWPSSGTVTIDPSVDGAVWAFGGDRTIEDRRLEPGCYKVLLNREAKIVSPPPYPTVCVPWAEALSFQVPAPGSGGVNSRDKLPVTFDQSDARGGQSGALGVSACFAILVSLLAMYFV